MIFPSEGHDLFLAINCEGQKIGNFSNFIPIFSTLKFHITVCLDENGMKSRQGKHTMHIAMISGIHIILAAQKYDRMENTTNVSRERRE